MIEQTVEQLSRYSERIRLKRTRGKPSEGSGLSEVSGLSQLNKLMSSCSRALRPYPNSPSKDSSMPSLMDIRLLTNYKASLQNTGLVVTVFIFSSFNDRFSISLRREFMIQTDIWVRSCHEAVPDRRCESPTSPRPMLCLVCYVLPSSPLSVRFRTVDPCILNLS
jgi:hypothetical protein